MRIVINILVCNIKIVKWKKERILKIFVRDEIFTKVHIFWVTRRTKEQFKHSKLKGHVGVSEIGF